MDTEQSYWKKLKEYPNQKYVGTKYNIVYWKIEDNKIWHQWKKIMNADIDSFEIHANEDFFARDKNFIYHAWDKVKDADRDTFHKCGLYWRDKNYLYFEYETSCKPLKGMDGENSVILDGAYAYDSKFGYHLGQVIKKCNFPSSLKVIIENVSFAKDKEHIYYEGAVLKNANINEWKIVNNSFYSMDNKSAYFGKHKLPRVDIETFELLSDTLAKDKNKVYNMAWVIENANAKEWNRENCIEKLKAYNG